MTHFLYFALGALGGGSLGAIIMGVLSAGAVREARIEAREAEDIADIYKRALHTHIQQTEIWKRIRARIEPDDGARLLAEISRAVPARDDVPKVWTS